MPRRAPAGSPPSPPDVFDLLLPLQNATFTSAGQAAMDFYKQNFTNTIVVYDATYIISINNFSELQRLKAEYDNNSNDFMIKLGDEIRLRKDAEAGFLSIFESLINVYKADANSSDYKPLTLNSEGKAVVKPCP